MKTYRHDLWVYLGIPCIIVMLIYIAYASWSFEEEMKGGEFMRYGLIFFSLSFAALTAYLFLRFAVVRYYITDDGLVVRGLVSSKTRLWTEIKSIKVNPHFKYLSVRDTHGKLVVFSSTDYFSSIQEFVDQISIRKSDNSVSNK